MYCDRATSSMKPNVLTSSSPAPLKVAKLLHKKVSEVSSLSKIGYKPALLESFPECLIPKCLIPEYLIPKCLMPKCLTEC